MLSKCLANTILKETRARLHEFSPCSLTSIVRAFGELGIQRLKLVQKVGEATYLLIQQFESNETKRNETKRLLSQGGPGLIDRFPPLRSSSPPTSHSENKTSFKQEGGVETNDFP